MTTMDAARWEKAADLYLLPALGDGWRQAGGRLVYGPVGWTAATMQPRPPRRRVATFQVEVIVWPLVVPVSDGYTCNRLLTGVFPEPDTVTGYEPVMPGIRDVVAGEGVEFLDRYGDVDGFIAYRRERWAGPDIVGYEELTYLHVVRGDWESARTEAALAEEAGAANRAGLNIPEENVILDRIRAVMALGPEGAREALSRNATATAAALGL